MIQLDDLDKPAAVEQLAKSGYDMLIVEPTFDVKGNESFDAKAMVKALHDGKPGRIVLAYLSIGEAESYRTYWKPQWHAPANGQEGQPGYLLGPDPDGWNENYLVRYWRPRWQALFTGKQGMLDKLTAAGFDGVYLDWVEAYDDEAVIAAAQADKAPPIKSMVNFIGAIRDHLRTSKPDALVVAQNAAFLVDDDPRFAEVIDGISFEDTWYSGKDNAKWDDANAGDIPNTEADEDSPSGLIRQYKKYQNAGLPVFTIDYCVNSGHAARVYKESAAEGFVPLVTRVSADNMTTTPPPNLPAPQP
jgi:cysteinyl-tRNA synthetase